MPLAYKVSLGFVGIAVLSFSYGLFVYERFNWIADSHPIDISSLGSYELHFAAQMDSSHEVILRTERKLEFREQNCKLGIETIYPSECVKFPQEYIISWAAYQGDKIIASGRSNETTSGIWGPKIGKTLGTLKAVRGEKYKIIAEIIKPDQSLAVTSPVIEIFIGRTEHKSAFVLASLANLAAILFIGVAGFISVVAFAYNAYIAKHNKGMQSDRPKPASRSSVDR